MSNFPSGELDHIRYVCMVDDQRARAELGYLHHFGIQQTLDAIYEEW